MPFIVITAEVEDSRKWEEGFRTHGELLRSMTSKETHFETTDDNHVTLCAHVDDVAKYMEVLQSPATIEAMAYDGVKRDTVQIHVLDKVFSYGA